MKFIHCADIHLGSKIEAKLPKEKADTRKREVRSAFSKMVDYAKNNDIHVILLSGDVFDSDRPLKKDKEFFYNVVKANPSIDFLYLRGNHDVKESYSEYGLENLKTFSQEWQTYVYDNIAISGIEISPDNENSLYSVLSLEPNKINIVMLHGQTGEGNGLINLSKLRNKFIDYLALGHIHTFSEGKIDNRGIYVYSGCLEGRGFDETGVKGFVVIDAEKEVKYQFVKNSIRIIDEQHIDISACKNNYDVYETINLNVKSDKNNLVRIVLEGEVDFDIEDISKELENRLSDKYFFVNVKNKAVRKYSIEKFAEDKSLKGEFIRTVLSNDEYSEEDKNEIITLGLKALDGREV